MSQQDAICPHCPAGTPLFPAGCPHVAAVFHDGYTWTEDFAVAALVGWLGDDRHERRRLHLSTPWAELAAGIPFWQDWPAEPDFSGGALPPLQRHPGVTVVLNPRGSGAFALVDPAHRPALLSGLTALAGRLGAEHRRWYGEDWVDREARRRRAFLPRDEVDDARWRVAHPFSLQCPLCGGTVRERDCPHHLKQGAFGALLARVPYLAGDALDDGVDLGALAAGLLPWATLPPAQWLTPADGLLRPPGVLTAVSESRWASLAGGPDCLAVREVPVASAEVRAALERDACAVVTRLEALAPSYRRRLGLLARPIVYGDTGIGEVLAGLGPTQAERVVRLALLGADEPVARHAVRLLHDAVTPLHVPRKGGDQLITRHQQETRAKLPPDACARLLALAAAHPAPAVRQAAERTAALLDEASVVSPAAPATASPAG